MNVQQTLAKLNLNPVMDVEVNDPEWMGAAVALEHYGTEDFPQLVKVGMAIAINHPDIEGNIQMEEASANFIAVEPDWRPIGELVKDVTYRDILEGDPCEHIPADMNAEKVTALMATAKHPKGKVHLYQVGDDIRGVLFDKSTVTLEWYK